MTVFSVANLSQLTNALQAARGGDTISLAAGNYGDVNLNNRKFASGVTITSAAGGKAHFDTLSVNNSSFLTVQNIDLGRGLRAGEPEYTKLVYVSDSANIRLDTVAVHGSMDGNAANDGIGLAVHNVTGFEVIGSRFEQVYRAMVLQQSSGVKLAGNSLTDMRSDGINIAAVIGVTIDNNRFTNFHPVGTDHPDAIQFWNKGQPYGSKDITITNNVVMNGDGVGPQGIFISDNNGWVYSNVLIKNNLIYGNGSYHGIMVDGATNVKIEGNSTLSRQDDNALMWTYVSNSSSVDVRGNLSERFIYNSITGLTQSSNQALESNPALKRLFGNLNAPASVQDLIISGVGYQSGAVASDTLPPAIKPPVTTIYGTASPWDTISGTSANEIIFGVAKTGSTGTGTRDTLYGGGGDDIFALGDARGLFYDDKDGSSAGRADSAAILDFDRGDKIQLVGRMSDYILKQEVINGHQGTSIFRDDNLSGRFDNKDEYIAHISGSPAASALSAADFVFVETTLHADTAMTAALAVSDADPRVADWDLLKDFPLISSEAMPIDMPRRFEAFVALP